MAGGTTRIAGFLCAQFGHHPQSEDGAPPHLGAHIRFSLHVPVPDKMVLTAEFAETAEMMVNDLTEAIIGGAIDVHRALGPGLLESTYEACLLRELATRELRVERQKCLPVHYKGMLVDCGYRIDLFVERQVIVELKAITRIDPIHIAQLLSYLRLSDCRIGLIINFNVRQLVTGIRRIVNDLPNPPRPPRSLR